MKQCLKSVLCVCLGWLLLVDSAVAEHRSHTEFSSVKPEKPWRLAYYQGGNYDNYYKYLAATVQGLMALGWIQAADLPEDQDARHLWSWLASNVESEYVVFAEDAFYSADWDEVKRSELRSTVINRLHNKQGIDLIFAMGTWAGKDLANEEHTIPTFVLSSSDPVESGIVKSVSDSGFDHVFARVAPARYVRQVNLFHNFLRFRKLGIAYENTVDGRAYTAIDVVKAVARERHFDIVECYTLSDAANENIANESVIKCITELVKQVDAIYVTAQRGVNQTTIPEIVDMVNRYRIPTFSQRGVEEVRYGLLMSLSPLNFKSVGEYLATSVIKVISGAKPRQLDQLFEEEPNIAINLKTAELIGMYLEAEVLAAADVIYQEIEQPAGYTRRSK
jgi:ABC-type uncharacterized transport system substrate-binding protein